MRQDSTFSYLLPDFLGNNSITLRADGVVQAVQLFSLFVVTRYSDGTIVTPFNFTGQHSILRLVASTMELGIMTLQAVGLRVLIQCRNDIGLRHIA